MPGPNVPSHSNKFSPQDERRMRDALELSPIPVFQPIVSLPAGAVVEFEALARWPTLGDPDPQLVFDLASETSSVLAQLDERCIAAALDSSLPLDPASDALLFVTTLPSCDFPSEAVDARAEQLRTNGLRLVFELL